MPLNANEVFPFLFQGGTPPVGWTLRELGFSAVVLCAEEEQFPAEMFFGIKVIHAPNDDNPIQPPSPEQIRTAIQAAHKVAALVERRQKVHVVCHAGKNRSGFVNTVAIHILTGWNGRKCIERIQSRRDGALFNPQFVRMLYRLPNRNAPSAGVFPI